MKEASLLSQELLAWIAKQNAILKEQDSKTVSAEARERILGSVHIPASRQNAGIPSETQAGGRGVSGYVEAEAQCRSRNSGVLADER